MPLEAGTTIEDLDSSYPLGGDSLNKGDDHLRLIKAILKTQFPGVDLNGFKIPIIATEDELNFISGVTSNVQTQFGDLGVRVSANEDAIANLIETGTKMVFYQAAAPNGWTLSTDTALSNHMMRVVRVNGGTKVTGDSPILNDKIPTHKHGISINTGTESRGHTHTYNTMYKANSNLGIVSYSGAVNENSRQNGTSGGVSQTHTHSISGNTANNSSGSSWEPSYANMIVCTKDAPPAP